MTLQEAQTAPTATEVPADILVRPELATLTVRQLMWERFTRNRLSVVAGVVIVLLYSSSALAGFLSPYALEHTHSTHPGVGPNGLHIIDSSGNLRWPFVYGYEARLDLQTYAMVYRQTDETYPVRFFAAGDEYTLLFVVDTNVHLFGVDEPGKLFLLGTDPLGRDFFTRILYGSQVSLTVGLVGIFLTVVIGSLVGVSAGLFGGVWDNVSMRIVEVLMSFPRIPLWMALAAALPANLNPIQVYFGITIVLSVIGWGSLSRQVRAKVLALRDLDYVMAARLTNCSTSRIIIQHLFPNTLSHVIVVATLAIPGMILGETALSFLGLGIRAPMTSWGLLLSDAQQLNVLLGKPWLLWAIVPVMVTAICFNLVGDGLRDAADPFAGE